MSEISEEIVKVDSLVLTQALAQSKNIIAELEKDVYKMCVSSDGIQDISVEYIEENRKASISVMENVINEINIPELTDFHINPTATQAVLLTKFEKESSELKAYKNNLRNNAQNMSDMIKSYKTREDLLADIAKGLNNREPRDKHDELRIANIETFKGLFSQLKQDYDFLLNKCCPSLKNDIKSILGSLNERRNSGEDDAWTTIEDVNAEAVLLLLENNIIMKNPHKNTFKFAP